MQEYQDITNGPLTVGRVVPWILVPESSRTVVRVVRVGPPQHDRATPDLSTAPVLHDVIRAIPDANADVIAARFSVALRFALWRAINCILGGAVHAAARHVQRVITRLALEQLFAA